MKKKTTATTNSEPIEFTNAYFETVNGELFEKVFGLDFGEGQSNYWLARIKDKAISGNRWYDVAKNKLLDKHSQRHPSTGERMTGPRGQVQIKPNEKAEFDAEMDKLMNMKVEGFETINKVVVYESKLPRKLVPNEQQILLPFIIMVWDGAPKGDPAPPDNPT